MGVSYWLPILLTKFSNLKLELPPTLRAPFRDEIPNNSIAGARLEELANAKIVEGYIIRDNEKNELPFKFFAEININNSKLWSLFTSLSDHLPNVVSCIYAFYRGDARFGNYLDKDAIMSTLGKFQVELVQDCFLEFGLIFHDNEKLVEVFVVEAKYVQFWGINKKAFFSHNGKVQFETNPSP